MSVPYLYLLLRCNKFEKDGQILCAHLDPFRWPGHILNCYAVSLPDLLNRYAVSLSDALS